MSGSTIAPVVNDTTPGPYTGNPVTLSPGTYEIIATGASGGAARDGRGGTGAEIGGEFTFASQTSLTIYAGGGSFVAVPSTTPGTNPTSGICGATERKMYAKDPSPRSTAHSCTGKGATSAASGSRSSRPSAAARPTV